MKPNELRIGNYIKTYGQDDGCITVTEISQSEVSFKERDSVKIDLLEPIPLTEEWLKKFGFDNSLVDEIYLYQHDSIKFPPTIIFFDNGEYIFRKRCEIKIQYVHQLQNLYFVLTGEELKLKY